MSPESSVPSPAPQGFNRGALVVTLAFAVAQDVVFALIFLSFMNYYLLDVVKASPAAPGYTLALYGGTKLIVHPLAGRLLDITWARLVCVLAVAIQAAGLVLLLSSGSLEVFYVSAVMLGVGSAMMWPLIYALVGGTQPEHVRPRVGAILAVTGYLSTGTGFGLGILFAETEARRAAFLVAALVLAIPAVSIATRLFPQRARAEEQERSSNPVTDNTRALLIFAVVIFVDYAAVSALAGLYGPYARRTLDLSLLHVSLLLVPAGISAGASLASVSKFSGTRHRFRDMALLYIAASAGAATLASTSTPWVAAMGAVPLAAGIGGIGPLVAATVLDAGSGVGRGVIIGALMSVEGLGSVLGPGVVAFVTDVFGPRGGFVVVGTMFGLLVLLTLTAHAIQRSERTKAAA